MKITKTQLKQIIKEELEAALNEKSFMDKLKSAGQQAGETGKGFARAVSGGQVGGCPQYVYRASIRSYSAVDPSMADTPEAQAKIKNENYKNTT